MKARKHQGHSGGLEGCPLCSRQEDPFADDVLEEEQGFQEPQADADPLQRRLDSIFGQRGGSK